MAEEKQESTVTTQPFHTEEPTMTLSSKVSSKIQKLGTKDAWVGKYNYSELCLPRWNPWGWGTRRQKRDEDEGGEGVGEGEGHTRRLEKGEVPFYGLEDDLPILLAILCGFQHNLAMLSGLITPPIIFATSLSLPPETQAYMISASLIACGFLSAIQMSAIPLPFGRQLGTGIVSVVGTSFATISTASAIFSALYRDGTCPLNADGSRAACPDAYGYLLGTSAVCSLLEMALSFVPPRVLKRVFPPVVTGVVVLLIGVNLIGESGFKNWGGGSGNCSSRPETGFFALCPNINAPRAYAWGDARFIGLGFLSFVTVIIVEIFGSPAMRNASIVLGLLLPLVVAGPLGYIDGSAISSAKPITFLWTTTFKLRIYAPAILPLLAVYISLMMEAIGDITATSDVSKLSVVGPEFDRRIAGGILSDGLNGCLAALFTVAPVSVFAQNVACISLTRVANRKAGYFCCAFLVLFGIIGKIGGLVLAIPAPILGGVTTYLFAAVATSGIAVLSKVHFTRRTRFVLAASLGPGFGQLLLPDWFDYVFSVTGPNKALNGFLQSIKIIVETPFLIAAICGIITNSILPLEREDREIRDAQEAEWKRKEEEYYANHPQRGHQLQANRDVEGEAERHGSHDSISKE
ncbi:unnamed protein product [Tilletia controversa]|uniref:Purine permease n=1 Tax=Tilletia controversa TaxID=13291 RepID=A0A8X7MPX5_9BASI|nr:hypothetical protein CF328_g5219 [Tilletia controversa]KAE8243786.1 hypothetical protein A4X06_0g6108 [Tilletia controversa]CAD6930688.1 unnamed protein product [Tilletia controversa]